MVEPFPDEADNCPIDRDAAVSSIGDRHLVNIEFRLVGHLYLVFVQQNCGILIRAAIS